MHSLLHEHYKFILKLNQYLKHWEWDFSGSENSLIPRNTIKQQETEHHWEAQWEIFLKSYKKEDPAIVPSPLFI